MFGDLFTLFKLFLKYGPTIRAAIVAANNSPEIVAGIAALTAALAEFHQATALPSTSPAPMQPAIPVKKAVEALQQHVAHGAEGQSPASI